MDGGRIQIRDRHEDASARDSEGYWRESLVGCCLSMTSEEHAADPCPQIPQTFVDPARMNDLSRDIKRFSGDREAAEGPPEEAPEDRDGRPQVLVKSVVATRRGVETFGRRLVAEAHGRGFHAARRKAFVGDGSATNWGVHRKHFSHYTPILDFTHAICYVYAAAMAGRQGEAAWRDYCQWAQWLWEGATAPLIAAVATRSAELGSPAKDDGASPAAIVAKTLGYLKNQRGRMKYGSISPAGIAHHQQPHRIDDQANQPPRERDGKILAPRGRAHLAIGRRPPQRNQRPGAILAKPPAPPATHPPLSIHPNRRLKQTTGYTRPLRQYGTG
jgi:hypothetical protein